ncbi:hypothetical protein [Metapseudomonas boanensis]|uniref:Ribbon-helix-helix protein CopG domain-containing protein n=1 Tax=Metapseudomonas boanensis TaxID=2822138 RepID=A0ABS5XM32_9GAMM|nr:hypothetical protein [Pseudomonas boanensis]MBT8768747.1 hypothetical protein [Pseudomonas boanensis]
MRDAIARTLRRNPHLIELIPSEKDQYLVPDKYLSWIAEDERQHHWLFRRVNDLTGRVLPRGLVHLTGRSEIVAMLDVWQMDIEEKALEIERLHDHWRRQTARDTQFEWFADKKEGAKRCVCAWEWIEKHPLKIRSRALPISNYNELLVFFDQTELGPSELKLVIREIKKRWHRLALDERNPDKKQVNVMLPTAVITQLDELAERHSMKRAQVVEALVRMEAETGMYLTDD